MCSPHGSRAWAASSLSSLERHKGGGGEGVREPQSKQGQASLGLGALRTFITYFPPPPPTPNESEGCCGCVMLEGRHPLVWVLGQLVRQWLPPSAPSLPLPPSPPPTPGSSDGLCRVGLFTGSCRRGTCGDRGPWDTAPAGPVCAPTPEEAKGGCQEDPAAAPGEGAAPGAGEPAASGAGAPHRWVVPPYSAPALGMEVQGAGEGWAEGRGPAQAGGGDRGRTDRTQLDLSGGIPVNPPLWQHFVRKMPQVSKAAGVSMRLCGGSKGCRVPRPAPRLGLLRIKAAVCAARPRPGPWAADAQAARRGGLGCWFLRKGPMGRA